MHGVLRYISSKLSSNSEAKASEFLDILEIYLFVSGNDLWAMEKDFNTFYFMQIFISTFHTDIIRAPSKLIYVRESWKVKIF